VELLRIAARESLAMLLESAPYALAGFFLAGLFRAFVPELFLRRRLGGKGPWPVLTASLIGVPLPLCSCGVAPAAAGLRRAGASKGAATAFMISTPETGPDSIAVNYALLDPVMTVARPLAAIAMATLTGMAVDWLSPDPPSAPATPAAPGEPGEMGGAVEPGGTPGREAAACGCSGGRCAAAGTGAGLWARLRRGMAYAFDEMLAEVGGWLLLGALVSGVIAALLPEDSLSRHLGSGLAPMAAMLLLSVPLNVCATASTPVVAALAAKGLSPGAALVFLLAGPASNIASLSVFARLFGPRATAAYLGCVAVCSLGFGLAVDALYRALGLDTARWLATPAADEPGTLAALCAAALVALVVRARLARRG
jgi:hypothetical protein